MKKILLSMCVMLAAVAGQAFASGDNDVAGNKRFTVSVSTGEGGQIEIEGTGAVSRNSVASATINTGEDVVLVITSDEGYELKTLYVDGSDVLADVTDEGTYTISSLSKNMSVSATFEQKVETYTVTVTAGEGGSIEIIGSEEATATFNVGENMSVKVTPDEGYVLASLMVGEDDYTAEVDEEGDCVLEFEAGEYTVVATFAKAGKSGDVNGDGDVNTGDVTAVYGYIINGDASGFVKEIADVNGDNDVNSADVVAIYNIIIGG